MSENKALIASIALHKFVLVSGDVQYFKQLDNQLNTPAHIYAQLY